MLNEDKFSNPREILFCEFDCEPKKTKPEETTQKIIVGVCGVFILCYGIFVWKLLTSNFKMPREPSRGETLSALLAPTGSNMFVSISF